MNNSHTIIWATVTVTVKDLGSGSVILQAMDLAMRSVMAPEMALEMAKVPLLAKAKASEKVSARASERAMARVFPAATHCRKYHL